MAATQPASVTFQNIYYERKTATARPCYVCRRPTQVVLATLKSEDFLYTCEGHLNDVGFATQLAAPPPGPSQEDIRKVVQEYNARENRKADRAKDKDDKDDKDKEDSKPSSPAPMSPTSAVAAGIPSAPAVTHRKFALHRSLFDNRRAELRRREQSTRAKEVSKGLPQVPRGSF